MRDQADRLREMAQNFKQQIEDEMMRELRLTRVIVISSGKGGVGKSTLALNISLNLCSRGKKVILMDADMGLANIDIMLGLVPQYNLQHVIQGKKSLKDITIAGPEGLKIIPGGSGMVELADLTTSELKKILYELGKMDGDYDFMVIDTGAGISKNVMMFLLAADDVIVVTTPEPTALTDAYGVVKAVSRQSLGKSIYLVVNRVNDNAEGIVVAEKFKLVCTKFLGLDIKVLGHVVNEPLVSEGIKNQQAFIEIYPGNRAARNINHITSNLVQSNVKGSSQDNAPGGGIKNFFRKLVGMIQ